MKLKHLFFCIACFVVVNNGRDLFANIDENIDSVAIDSLHTQVVALITDICDFLLQGHSTDEVMAMLNNDQNYQCNIQKLVTHIQELLNQQHSKGNIINIIIINEGAYTRESFWIKHGYALCKFVVIFVIVIIACYLLYKLAQWLPPFPWFGASGGQSNQDKEDQGNAGANQKSGGVQLISQDEESESPRSGKEQNQKKPMQSEQEDDLDFSNLRYEYNETFAQAIDQKLEKARRIGLKSAAIKSDDLKVKKKSKNNRKFEGYNKLIDLRIKYARSIGLNPSSKH